MPVFVKMCTKKIEDEGNKKVTCSCIYTYRAFNAVPLRLLAATVEVPLRVLTRNCTKLKLQSRAAELRVYPAM